MTTARHIDTQAEITWLAAAGVQPVVYIARLNDRPIAILVWGPGVGFELTSCEGEVIGRFDTQDEAESALECWAYERRTTGARALSFQA